MEHGTSEEAKVKQQPHQPEAALIVDRIEAWAGSREAAWTWYRTYPIAALGGGTAASLVAEGRVQEVVDYLAHLEAGGYA